MTVYMPVIVWIAGTLISAFIGSYLAGYLRKKGENLATHEDLNKLVDQMKAVTQATKEIEANISDKAWNRQKHWEMKREAVFCVMQALGHADESLAVLALSVRRKNEAIQEASALFYRHIDDFDEKRALAMIVCGDDMSNTLITLKDGLRLVASKLLDGEVNAYEESTPNLKPYFARAFALSRRELGIEIQIAD